MEPLSLNELRERYLSFFESKGHLRLPSFPLVPQGDGSLLLINAGMAPLKPYFTGERVPPRKRVTTCQKCVRTLDIDNVGKTARHGTFFEMLGNFSFGDYFKQQAIPWAWEFLTQDLKIPADRLYPSVYVEDDEAIEVWEKTGVSRDRIVRLGKDDNFWEIGAGPCGPCSEIYFDRGEQFGCGKPDCGPGCDCDRFVEIWNIVFTQFDGDGKGGYTRLAHPNIDTGMGLERLACVMQGVGNLFEVDTIRNIITEISRISGTEYTGASSDTDVSIRVITDHIRTATFLVSDGVIPSNEGRGYILRRVLRRAARHGKLLGISGPFLSGLCDAVIRESGKAYPELEEKRDYIKKTIEIEEERFRQTLDSGLAILSRIIADTSARGGKLLSGEDLFRLYDTFGFPVDLTREIAAEKGLGIDEKAFGELMIEQKRRAREARAALGDNSWNEDVMTAIDRTVPTLFTGYESTSADAEIKYILSDGEAVNFLPSGKAVLVLDRTPFYAESGGQVGDTGVISVAGGSFIVEDTKKTHENQYLHIGHIADGVIRLGPCHAEVDAARRSSIARNHSSVHLLQAALRRVLGTHVEQAGSYVDEHRARFDFTHFAAMTSDELRETERLVNEEILRGDAVVTELKSLAEAKKDGAMALFGEKYGDVVREVMMGDFSAELCGGTHVDNTAKVGMFKIVSEGGVAAGVRRIEAITGMNTLASYYDKEAVIDTVRASLKANSVSDLPEKAEAVQAEIKALGRELGKAQLAIVNSTVKAAEKQDISGVLLTVCSFEDIPSDILRTASDGLVGSAANNVCVFSTVTGGRLSFAASAGKEAVARGAHAGMLLKKLSAIVGGGGGGRPDSATSGGKDLTRLGEALDAAAGILAEMIK